MNIEFTGAYAKNENFGINFQAKVNDQPVSCVVSVEALQDIKPDSRMDAPEQQYLDNKYKLEAIAEEKISNGQVVNGQVLINQSDIL